MSAIRAVDEHGAVQVDRVRGGLSFWSILTGALVALGAFVLLAAIVGAILAATGVVEEGIRPEDVQTAGIGALIGLLFVQFLSYLWEGIPLDAWPVGPVLLTGSSWQ